MQKEQNHNPGVRNILLPAITLVLVFGAYNLVALRFPHIAGYQLNSLYISIVSLAGAIIFIPFISYIKKSEGAPEGFSFKFPAVSLLALLVALGIALKIILNPFFYPGIHFSALNEGNLMINSFGLLETGIKALLDFAAAVVIFPVFMEIFWRGQVQEFLTKRLSPAQAILLSSALFAISHWKADTIVALFIWGLVMGIVYHRTKSLMAAIFLHSFYNLLEFFSGYRTILANDQLFLLNFMAFLLSIVVVSGIVVYIGLKPAKRVEEVEEIEEG
jgi:membrane protease YdiL (CAAX protease family)